MVVSRSNATDPMLYDPAWIGFTPAMGFTNPKAEGINTLSYYI